MTTVGSIGDLQPGAHACMTFAEEDERLDLMAAFVQIGLSSGAKALCLTEAIAADELAGAQEASQLRIQVSHGRP